MPLHRGDVIKMGSEDPAVVVNVNDCRASLVSLRGRDWQKAETKISPSEHTFGISPNTEVGDYVQLLGRFQGIIENRPSMYFERDSGPREVITVPIPSRQPPAKKRKKPVSESIEDDDESPSIFTLLQRAAKITATLSSRNVLPSDLDSRQ